MPNGNTLLMATEKCSKENRRKNSFAGRAPDLRRTFLVSALKRALEEEYNKATLIGDRQQSTEESIRQIRFQGAEENEVKPQALKVIKIKSSLNVVCHELFKILVCVLGFCSLPIKRKICFFVIVLTIIFRTNCSLACSQFLLSEHFKRGQVKMNISFWCVIKFRHTVDLVLFIYTSELSLYEFAY